MLVLARKQGQTIVIGDARVVVTSIDGNQVRLGIEAPPGVEIVREELMQVYPREQPAPFGAKCSACGDPALVRVYYTQGRSDCWCERHQGDWFVEGGTS